MPEFLSSSARSDHALPAGRAAEEQVAAVYRALGYEVRRDVSIDGNQIDVFAQQRLPLLDIIRVCIEVKDHPGRSVPIDEVRAFANVANLLVSGGQCEQAHLITTGTFSRNSRKVIEKFPALKLLTYSELERQIFAPGNALSQWLQVYRQSPIHVVYVDLLATLIDFEVSGPVEAVGILPASQLIDIATGHPDCGILVFGDYGAGKTTVLQRIKANAIQRHKIDESAAVPLLIPLRNLSDGMDCEQLALHSLRTELGLSMPISTFWNLLEARRFLILLDGFDEITLRADSSKRTELLAAISPLLFGASPAMITSRPSYFTSTVEYKECLRVLRTGGRPPPRRDNGDPGAARLDAFAARLSDRYIESGPLNARDAQFVSYRLDSLTSEQIDEYLQHVSPQLETLGETTPDEVRSFLDGIYDLSDLITRPIILDMAVASILAGQINPRDRTLANGPAGIYEAYARVKLDVDWRKAASRRDLLTYEERMKFAEGCALAMFQGDVLTISEQEVLTLVRRAVPDAGDVPYDEILTDLRTCSFLTVDGDGGLRFIHRSYQEFFLARLLRRELQQGSTRGFTSPLRWEYTYFLGAFAFTDNKFYSDLLDLAQSRSEGYSSVGMQNSQTMSDNAAQAVLAARESATSLAWTGRSLFKVKRPRLTLRSSTLQDVAIDELTTEEFEIVDTKLSLTVTGGSIGEFIGTRCTGSVQLHGQIGAVALNGGDLVITDVSTAASLNASDMRLNLISIKRGPCAVDLRGVTGKAKFQGGEMAVDGCQLEVEVAEGVMRGRIANSIVEMPVGTFDSLVAQVVASAVVVKGTRPGVRNVGQISRQSSRILATGDAAGHESVVFLSPSIPLDKWWAHQSDILTFGGGADSSSPAWSGVTVNWEALAPWKGQGSFVRVRPNGFLSLVVEGRGEALQLAAKDLQSLVASVGWRALREPRWFTSRMRTLLQELDAPSEAVDPILAVADQRLSVLRSHCVDMS